MDSYSKSAVSIWLIWSKNKHAFKLFSGRCRMKKRQSEEVRGLCYVRWDGGGGKEQSSVAIKSCEE